MSNYRKFSGGCLCGNVTYSIEGEPVIVAQCHCEECRKSSGTGHTIGAMFSAEKMVLRGTVGNYKYASSMSSEVTKVFCPNCGSPLYGTNSRSPDHLTVSLGTLDDADDLRVQVVIFAQEEKHWDQLGDQIARFDRQPEWQPEG